MSAIGGMMTGRGGVVDPAVLMRMGKAMVLRGRDQQGMYWDRGIGLYHCRSFHGTRPALREPLTVCREGRSYTVVIDGEIDRCDRMAGCCDAHGLPQAAEVVLESYLAYGYACVEVLEGAFAFAVYDKARHELFLARDRQGRKPLYYAEANGSFYFASELRGLLTALGGGWLVDVHRVEDLFLRGEREAEGAWVYTDACVLPPSHFAVRSGIGTAVFSYRGETEERGERAAERRMPLVMPRVADLERDLHEALFAFSYPAFRWRMPYLQASLRQMQRLGYVRGAVGMPQSEACYGSADRLGMLYGVLLRCDRREEIWEERRRLLRQWERLLREWTEPLLAEGEHPLHRVLGSDALAELSEQSDRERKVEMLGRLYQVARWMEQYPVLTEEKGEK